MNARDRAAFRAGIEAARQMALTAAMSLEIRPDAREVRQQAAAAALQGLADGLRVAFLDTAAVACSPPVKTGETASPNLLPERASE